MLARTAIFIVLLVGIRPGYGQHQDVFPGLSGQTLLDSLVSHYKSSIPLSQADARDTLFGIIDNHDDSLTCVYTGFTIWLDPTLDPTQAAFIDDTNPDGINTEHTYPKANGATGRAEGDMHHLYPTRKDVNNDRGNFPFAEIPDDETEAWYYQNQITSIKPTAHIELYSEKRGAEFEPPEAHKGNVARAMFYFYTMYKDQADQANPTFFEIQRQTLCAWHFQDPADEAEWLRTWKIALYQDGIPNPFVLDCTLPERSYCQDVSLECMTTALGAEQPEPVFQLDPIHPNPAQSGTTFSYSVTVPGQVVLEITGTGGTILETIHMGYVSAGQHTYFWERPVNLPAGLYICRFHFDGGHLQGQSVQKMILLP